MVIRISDPSCLVQSKCILHKENHNYVLFNTGVEFDIPPKIQPKVVGNLNNEIYPKGGGGVIYNFNIVQLSRCFDAKSKP